ncbi:hypothetical protein TB2_023100 [Malus domestica]
MLKFVISLLRKIVPAAEANVPSAGIMAKLQSGNNVLRNNSRKLEKHLEARVKILEAINKLHDQDRVYITSVQHAKLLDRLRRGDKLTDKEKSLLNSEGKPETKLEAKLRREEENKLLKVPLWHGNTIDILKDLSKCARSVIHQFYEKKGLDIDEFKVLPAGVRID